ncbi:TOBE domain-containing protein [Desulforhopalus singaporensis]|nr:TOBE domain-containing protein [Desulforhopalus singaporensis]
MMDGKSVPGTDEMRKIMGWEISSITAVELLRRLDQTGSINSAAKAVGLSYKSAWQKLEQLNNIVPYPLVSKQTGGSGGGGTVLTREGRELLRHVRLLEKEFARFMEFFSGDPEDALDTLKTLRRLEMKISARNVWAGKVVEIEQGAVNCVVNIQLKGGDRISSVITDNSVRRLELAPDSEVMVIVKASCVLLGKDTDPAKISARNILVGTVGNIVPGVVNDEVTIDLPGGSAVTSIITSSSVRRLGLKVGDPLTAVIKATDVLLAIV